MDKPNFEYAVMLPLELKDRHGREDAMTAKLPIVTINVTERADPSGVQRGTILSNPHSDSDPYADLVFRSYLSWRTGTFEVVSWELEYQDVFSVDLARAERMTKLLKRIRKAHNNLPVSPSGFSQYVVLLGAAIGIKYMAMPEDEETERRNHYPDGWYRINPIRDAQNYVFNLLSDVARKYVPGKPVGDVRESRL
ncbi:MAG: hypothetical protein JWQ87_2283 [Candidatus Sulfotelmatobacter sp.]|nr:hypothetical protein [Candidatus Sulfotelmatobacter sp.]